MTISNRLMLSLLALACAGLLGYGYYLQFVEHLDPCPMCILQRLCYAAIGILAIGGAVVNPGRGGALICSALIAACAAIGAGIAARQTWLQHLPPELVPECGPGLEFMLEMYPLLETIEKSLKGTGDCAEVTWRFLGFSIAEWSLLWFLAILLAALWQFTRNYRGSRAQRI